MAERTLISYLVRPRIPTWSLVQVLLVAYVVVSLVHETTAGVAVGAALVAGLVFEFGFYQARYLFNDLADTAVDRMHVAAKARGRLPAVPGARQWAWRAVVVRLVLSTAAVALLPGRARTLTAVAVLLLIGVTVAYETTRMLTRRSAGPARPPLPEIAVLGLVGAGRGLRFGFGAVLAGADGKLVVACGAFGWAYGAMTEIMWWILEAAGLQLEGDAAVLARKPHIGLLARLIGDDPHRLQHPFLAGPAAWLAGMLLVIPSALAVLVGAALSGAPLTGRVVLLAGICAVAGPLVIARFSSSWAGPAAMAFEGVAVAILAPGDAWLGIGALLLLTSGAASLARTYTPAGVLKLSPSAGTPGG